MARTALAVVCILVASFSIHSQSSDVTNEGRPPAGLPFTLQEFEELTPEARSNPRLFAREIERRKIAFLPTKELREEKKNEVPKEVLDVLKNHVALFLQVSEFECRNCRNGSSDGRIVAELVLDEIKALTNTPLAAGNPLYRKSYLPKLGSSKGAARSGTPHVYILINGRLFNEGRRERLEIDLAYINGYHVGVSGLGSETWENINRQIIGSDVALWVAGKLRSALD